MFKKIKIIIIRFVLYLKIEDLKEEIDELESIIPLYERYGIPTKLSISRLNSYKNLVRRIELIRLKY
jgi:hypothetical protein